MIKRIIITGAPGTGKSTLIQALAAQGFSIVEEPARDIIAEQRLIGGDGLWEKNTASFLSLLLSRSIERFTQTAGDLTLYDRGIPDCIAYAELAGSPMPSAHQAASIFRYHPEVFIAPPWAAIYTTDDERTMSFRAVCSFYEHLVSAYAGHGYELIELPCATVAERMNFVCERRGG